MQSRPLLAIINEDYPKIRNVSNIEENDGLINYLIVLMNIKTSSQVEKHDLEIQMIVALDFIKFKFGFLTIPEIKEAFKMYVAKDFGHKEIFRNLDTILVSDVLNCFMNYRSDNLRSYNQKKQKLELVEKNALSNSEKEEIMTNAVNEKYLEYIYTQDIEQPIVHIFDELMKRKLIKMPDEKTINYYNSKLQEASNQILKELKSIVSADKKENLSIKEELDKITNKNSQKVEIRAKKLVLMDFFKKQHSLGKDNIL